MLRNPTFSGAWQADQQQGAVGSQGGDGDLDHPPTADVLWLDHGAIAKGATKNIGSHGPGRKPPASRARAVVLALQGAQFLGVLMLGMLTEALGHTGFSLGQLQIALMIRAFVGQVPNLACGLVHPIILAGDLREKRCLRQAQAAVVC